MELAAADLEARLSGELETFLVCVPETPAMLFEPGGVLAEQQLPRGDVLHHPRRPPRGGPVPARHRTLRSVQRLADRIDVDPRVGRERNAKLRATLEREQSPKLGDQCRYCRVRCCGEIIVPERPHELVATDRAPAIEQHVGKEEPSLPPRNLRLHLATVDLGAEAAAEMDTRRQAGAKVTTTLGADTPDMAKILVNVTNGPEHPTKAALAFLVARAAQDAGHDVSLFLAGDAVQLLRPPVLDSLVGLGTGSLRESYDALRAGGASWYVSGMSSMTRGFEPDGVAEPAMPSKLVELSVDADRVLTY